MGEFDKQFILMIRNVKVCEGRNYTLHYFIYRKLCNIWSLKTPIK